MHKNCACVIARETVLYDRKINRAGKEFGEPEKNERMEKEKELHALENKREQQVRIRKAIIMEEEKVRRTYITAQKAEVRAKTAEVKAKMAATETERIRQRLAKKDSGKIRHFIYIYLAPN